MWQEDDVVHALTERWRPVSTVLASGGNQSTLHFVTASGRRKSPDVIAYCDGSVVLLEAKVRAAGLFCGTHSDVSHLQSLLADPQRRDQLLLKVVLLLRSMSRSEPTTPQLVCGVLAGSAFSPERISLATGLVCVEATPAGGVRAVAGASLLPARCQAPLD